MEEGGKLIHKQLGKPHNCTYVREVQGDTMVMVSSQAIVTQFDVENNR